LSRVTTALAGALAAACLVVAAPAWGDDRAPAGPAKLTASERLTSVAGHPIHCWPDAAWRTRFPANAAGYTDRERGEVHLHGMICHDLLNLLGGRYAHERVGMTLQGWAVFVLAHEEAHLSGIVDESEADRVGLAHYLGVCARLRVPTSYGNRIRSLVAPAADAAPSR